MKLAYILAVSIAAAMVPVAPIASAATSLTGLQVISTDSSGNADLQSPQAWNTRNTSGRTKLWIIKGEADKPFLNGPTHLEAGIDIPMTSGTYTYTLFTEPINSVLKPQYSLSFFFDLDATPAITVFSPLNTASNQFFPDWFPVATNSGWRRWMVQPRSPTAKWNSSMDRSR